MRVLRIETGVVGVLWVFVFGVLFQFRRSRCAKEGLSADLCFCFKKFDEFMVMNHGCGVKRRRRRGRVFASRGREKVCFTLQIIDFAFSLTFN